MKVSEIKKKYNNKINELKNHNKLYFDKSTPKISDKEYDKIKREILDLENKFSFFRKKENLPVLLFRFSSKHQLRQ